MVDGIGVFQGNEIGSKIHSKSYLPIILKHEEGLNPMVCLLAGLLT